MPIKKKPDKKFVTKRKTAKVRKENDINKRKSNNIKSIESNDKLFRKPYNNINDNQEYRQSPTQTITTSYSDAVKNKPKNIVLFSDSILKNLRMDEFNSYVENGQTDLKTFSGARANQMHKSMVRSLKENDYDIAIVHVGINDLLNRRNIDDSCIEEICNDIINVGMRCRDFNIGMIFISGISYSARIRVDILSRVNKSLESMCCNNGFFFINNGRVSESDLWTDGIHLLERGQRINANNLINNLNHFLFLAKNLAWRK